MSDITRKLEGAREHVAVEWTDERAREVQALMRERQQRRQKRARIGTVATALVALVIGLAWRRSSPHPVLAARTTVPAHDGTLRLDDGSTITPHDDSTVVVLSAIAPDRVELALKAGSARIDVPTHSGRIVSIDARVARVEASDGVFTVAVDGDRARVSVEQGSVRVLWGIEEALLREGESGAFPPAPSAASSAPEVQMAPMPVPPALPTHASGIAAMPPAPSAWRAQARDGDFERAFQTLQTAGSAAVHDEPTDLLLAADVARLSRHPADAVKPLQQVIREHAADPRAPLAAFTLGRVLLDELGRPAEAANAFSKARTLGPGGPLEEDALAREVEAWSRAGDAEKARAAAELYVSRYPDGRRLRAVRKFGELE